jgi:hypothetical protein
MKEIKTYQQVADEYEEWKYERERKYLKEELILTCLGRLDRFPTEDEVREFIASDIRADLFVEDLANAS